MKTIPLTQGKVALVDDEDYTRVSQHQWWAVRQGKTYYAHRHVTVAPGKYTRESLHRFIMRPGPKEIVDHIDRNGLNCTRANMRISTPAQNRRNAPKNTNNKSGYKGVHQRKDSGMWVAQIRDAAGKRIYLGNFSSAQAAAKAYDFAAKLFHGEFAQTNF